MGQAGHVACMGARTGVNMGLVGKPEGKRPQVRPRHRSGDNIKIHRQELGWGGRA
jgi:hypothetical protein